MVQFLCHAVHIQKVYRCKKYQLVTVPDLNARQMFLELLYLHQRLQSMDKWGGIDHLIDRHPTLLQVQAY